MLSTNLSGILFASLANPVDQSNATVNDWIREQQITQTLSLINEAIFSNRGVVTKSLKDGVIGTFPSAESALQAVIKINLILDDNEQTNSGGGYWCLGLHYAKLHVIAGSVSGEGLETAIFLANSADNAQTLVSDAMSEQLKLGELPSSVVLQPYAGVTAGQPPIFDLIVNNGDEVENELPTTPLPVVALSAAPEVTKPDASELAKPDAPKLAKPDPSEQAKPDASEQVAPAPSAEDPAQAISLDLVINSMTYSINEQTPQFTVGRGKENNVRIRGTHVSRDHGHFEFRDGQGYYVDHSSNGSCLLRGELQTLIHNEELLLTGSGQICLAPSQDKSPDHLIDFTASY